MDVIEFLQAYKSDTPPIPTIKPGDRIKHHLYDEGTVDAFDYAGDGRALVDFDAVDVGKRLIPHADLEVVE